MTPIQVTTYKLIDLLKEHCFYLKSVTRCDLDTQPAVLIDFVDDVSAQTIFNLISDLPLEEFARLPVEVFTIVYEGQQLTFSWGVMVTVDEPTVELYVNFRGYDKVAKRGIRLDTIKQFVEFWSQRTPKLSQT